MVFHGLKLLPHQEKLDGIPRAEYSFASKKRWYSTGGILRLLQEKVVLHGWNTSPPRTDGIPRVEYSFSSKKRWYSTGGILLVLQEMMVFHGILLLLQEYIRIYIYLYTYMNINIFWQLCFAACFGDARLAVFVPLCHHFLRYARHV